MITQHKQSGYCILSATSLKELAEDVQKLLDAGWKVTGGVAPGVDEANGIFTQAMTL